MIVRFEGPVLYGCVCVRAKDAFGADETLIGFEMSVMDVSGVWFRSTMGSYKRGLIRSW